MKVNIFTRSTYTFLEAEINQRIEELKNEGSFVKDIKYTMSDLGYSALLIIEKLPYTP